MGCWTGVAQPACGRTELRVQGQFGLVVRRKRVGTRCSSVFLVSPCLLFVMRRSRTFWTRYVKCLVLSDNLEDLSGYVDADFIDCSQCRACQRLDNRERVRLHLSVARSFLSLQVSLLCKNCHRSHDRRPLTLYSFRIEQVYRLAK